MQVDGVAVTAEATQAQVTTIQTSINALTQQVTELRTFFQNHGDDESDAAGQGDNQEQLGRGGDRGD